MQTPKRRILMVNEGSHLLTGYSTYGLEVLSRLHKAGKYELAELACFTNLDSKANSPWKVYANNVSESDPRYKDMMANPSGVFGSWRLDRVLLDFKPDIVFSIRDFWMDSFINNSELRDYFHFSWMPTVDSSPQNEAWIENFIKIDSVFTYSDWGQEVLKKEGGELINLCGVASPGVDLDVFYPVVNRIKHKENLGIDGDVNIIGTVMRNQKRKLYPDLFESFAKFLKICEENNRLDIAQKTYLYCHTGYPDAGWSMPTLLKEHGLFHKVLFTYVCRDCQNFFPSFFQDSRTTCKHCGGPSATMPNTSVGLDRKQLASVYNMFDAYVQYSNCEGFGMPMVEAMACGCPLFVVDYSAMSEVGTKSKGQLIPPKAMFLELETGAYRAYPDNDFTANALFKFFCKPSPMRARQGFSARFCAEENYSWDDTAKIWERHFDSVELKGRQGRWDAPIRQHTPPSSLPEQYLKCDNATFTDYLMLNVLGQPELINSHYAMEITKTLNFGLRKVKDKFVPIKRQELFQSANNKAIVRNKLESARLSDNLVKEDYIMAANQ